MIFAWSLQGLGQTEYSRGIRGTRQKIINYSTCCLHLLRWAGGCLGYFYTILKKGMFFSLLPPPILHTSGRTINREGGVWLLVTYNTYFKYTILLVKLFRGEKFSTQKKSLIIFLSILCRLKSLCTLIIYIINIYKKFLHGKK